MIAPQHAAPHAASPRSSRRPFDPLAVLDRLAARWTPLAPAYVFLICWPTYASAFVAVVPARVLQRLGRRLREAQDLGSYQLIERLGTGGMGEVWRAEHRLLARDAAIKLVRPEVLGARDENEARVTLKRFEREAQATAALSSPHTIQVFDFGITEDGTFYYVMELLNGRDLESLVREFGPLPPNRVIYLLRQVCHSLADAHARGLVHRDIKPANIYVCRMGLEYDFAKVLDFGLVKMQARAGRTSEAADTHDGGELDAWNAGLHGSRSHPRGLGRRSAGGRLFPRLRGVLPAHRRAGLRRRHLHEDADAAPSRAAGAAFRADGARGAARAR